MSESRVLNAVDLLLHFHILYMTLRAWTFTFALHEQRKQKNKANNNTGCRPVQVSTSDIKDGFLKARQWFWSFRNVKELVFLLWVELTCSLWRTKCVCVCVSENERTREREDQSVTTARFGQTCQEKHSSGSKMSLVAAKTNKIRGREAEKIEAWL